MVKILLYLKKFDWILFFSILLLLSFGLIEIYSIALSHEVVDLINFKKQVLFIFVGIFLMFFFSFLDFRFFKNFVNYIYIFGVVILIGVLFFGDTIRGTKGWFNFLGFGIQPVEFIKIILILFLANFFSLISAKKKTIMNLILSGMGVVVFAGLVIMQPDFGSAMLLFFSWGVMVLLAGFKKKYIFSIILLIIFIFASGWLFYFDDYQKDRISTFLNINQNSLEEGYNVRQAIIAVGSGGFMGRGVGFGSQSQLKFLPEAQNDFIFAVIAEELGFLGTCLLIFFFVIFFYRCLVSLKKVDSDFGAFFILGSMGLIFIEMFINIGMNIGILPIVGISLPFVSYGGSAILSNMIFVGIIESVIIRSRINY